MNDTGWPTDMDENANNESLLDRIRQLEKERDELRKDIEQLCMQQAGPSYLAVATRMHFQRTAGLEQEIENLKKMLAACTRDNLNLQEELSEAYRIKGQLADLHSAEVSKNMDAEKQVKFFHGCVAAAFAERDNAIMEAEKAKEKEEIASRKLFDLEKRIEELTSDCLELKKQHDVLYTDLAEQEEQIKTFKMVIGKFYEIKQRSLEDFEDMNWDDKCGSLLHDPEEIWSYNDTSTSKYISALEEELKMLRNSVDNLQSKLRMGLEIENHLKKRIKEMEKKQSLKEKIIMKGIAELRCYHSLHREHITNMLHEGELCLTSLMNVVEEKVRKFEISSQLNQELQIDAQLDEHECQDRQTSTLTESDLVTKLNGPSLPVLENDGKAASEALAQAMKEKVAALLLLSQQEERHLLERNVNSALQKKVEELRRNLLQVTNEKVKSLMELAQLKQEHHLLLEKLGQDSKQGKPLADTGERKLITHERDGRLKNLLKKTYLNRWIGPLDAFGNEATIESNNEGKFFRRQSNSMDFARMRIENATLKESLESMEHLTSVIHRLHISLLKARDSVTCEDTMSSSLVAIEDIINEAKLVKTALGSSLPVSWSANADESSLGEMVGNALEDLNQESSHEKIDSVSAAGFEMVELLTLAGQMLKDNIGHGS